MRMKTQLPGHHTQQNLYFKKKIHSDTGIHYNPLQGKCG